MDVRDLKPASYNPRSISDQKLWMLGKSLRVFGDISGIVFNIRTGHLVGGHQRLKHLDPAWPVVKEPHSDQNGTVAKGYIDTPFGQLTYREVDWSENWEKSANIAANQHGGKFDEEKLKKVVEDIASDEQFDLPLLGFDANELKYIAKRDLYAPTPLEDTGETGESQESRRIIILLDEEWAAERVMFALNLFGAKKEKVTYRATDLTLPPIPGEAEEAPEQEGGASDAG